VRRIHHFGITVAKLDRSLAFYRDLLGMTVLGISGDEEVGAIVGIPGARVRAADIDAGNGQVLELLEYASSTAEQHIHGPDMVGTCHLSFQVGDLASTLSRLGEAGFRPMGEIAALTEGGVWQDCTVVYLRDPDGVIVELVERGTDG
jgi:catechol 2,3-dioxygenase-like lactoylglutathione lyase family enzyme